MWTVKMKWIYHFQYGFRPRHRFSRIICVIWITRRFWWWLITIELNNFMLIIIFWHLKPFQWYSAEWGTLLTLIFLVILHPHLLYPVQTYHFDRRLMRLYDEIESNLFVALKCIKICVSQIRRQLKWKNGKIEMFITIGFKIFAFLCPTSQFQWSSFKWTTCWSLSLRTSTQQKWSNIGKWSSLLNTCKTFVLKKTFSSLS